MSSRCLQTQTSPWYFMTALNIITIKVRFPKSDLWCWDGQGWWALLWCAIFWSKFVSCWRFLVFYSIHWLLFIVWDLENKLAASCQYIKKHTLYLVMPTPKSAKQLYLMQHSKERQGSNHSHIIPYQKDLKWSPVMSAYCIV